MCLDGVAPPVSTALEWPVRRLCSRHNLFEACQQERLAGSFVYCSQSNTRIARGCTRWLSGSSLNVRQYRRRLLPGQYLQPAKCCTGHSGGGDVSVLRQMRGAQSVRLSGSAVGKGAPRCPLPEVSPTKQPDALSAS